MLLYHCVHVHMPIITIGTQIFPHQSSRKTAIRFPWHLFNHVSFLFIYDHILSIFPGDPDLHFPCLLSSYPKTGVRGKLE